MAYLGTKPTDAVLETDDIADGVVTSAKIADGTIATADISDSAVTKAKTTGVVSDPFRNIIINGDMSIAQRSTSVSGITGTDSGYKTLDRFYTEISSAGTWTQSQSTDVPSGQGFAKSFKMDCTTATASPTFLSVDTYFEGQNLQYLKKGTSSAKSLTLSFWVKSSKTGTHVTELRDHDNNRTISRTYTISSANTWEKKELTFVGDTTGAFANDNGRSLDARFFLAVSSTYSSGTLATSWESRTNANRAVGQVNLADSTANEWYITGVQLEAGTTASDFEFLPYDINWLKCLRYCIILGSAPGGTTYNYADNSIIGYYYNNTDFYPNYFYPVPMRATPGVTFSTTGSGLGVVYSDGAGDTTTSNGTNVTSNTNFNFRASTAQTNQTYGGAFDFSANQYAILSAEL